MVEWDNFWIMSVFFNLNNCMKVKFFSNYPCLNKNKDHSSFLKVTITDSQLDFHQTSWWPFFAGSLPHELKDNIKCCPYMQPYNSMWYYYIAGCGRLVLLKEKYLNFIENYLIWYLLLCLPSNTYDANVMAHFCRCFRVNASVLFKKNCQLWHL